MMNENQKEYTVNLIKKYEKEADKADRKSFWQSIGVDACIIVIAAASVLTKKEIIPGDIALGAQVLAGITGVSLLSEAIGNNSKRNVSEKQARELHYYKEMDNLEEPITGKHLRK